MKITIHNSEGREVLIGSLKQTFEMTWRRQYGDFGQPEGVDPHKELIKEELDLANIYYKGIPVNEEIELPDYLKGVTLIIQSFNPLISFQFMSCSGMTYLTLPELKDESYNK